MDGGHDHPNLRMSFLTPSFVLKKMVNFMLGVVLKEPTLH